MLKTPLGEIGIFIDDIPIPYIEKTVPKDRRCGDLDGRFSVTVELVPDGKEHTVSCRIKGYVPTGEDYVETGENLECKSFISNGAKLSIGMEGDDRGYLNGERACNTYDYDNGYLDDGVEYIILKFTKTDKFIFGIAWVKNHTESNDVQTWFGADPTLF